MKPFFSFSPINKKAILLTCCFLLFPISLVSGRAQSEDKLTLRDQGSQSSRQVSLLQSHQEQQKTILLAQANTSEANSQEETDTDSKKEDAKNLITYSLEFNRSPIVGNRMRLHGLYSEGRLGFTRPRSWNVKDVKALIRFQHSPTLYTNRSNLTVLVNDTAVGSIQLKGKKSEIGQVLLNIPSKLLQDYNEVKLVVQQNTSPECSDPNDPNLWTDILPDSKIIFKFQRQPMPLNFSRYPYPYFDDLGLETNNIVYLQPTQTDQYWLTAAARLQATFGRFADFRPVETSMVVDVADVKPEQRLVIIGTPSEQPILTSMKLPLSVTGGEIIDGNKKPIPEDTGVLIATTTKSAKEGGGTPVLIATGNGATGVTKAVQFLVQADFRKMGTGSVLLVNQVKDTPIPETRQWPGYLPQENTFRLSDLRTGLRGQPFKDVTVRGSSAPSIDINFRALPDDRFLRGSSMNLVYSYGPQMNPRTSAIQVLLDDQFIGGARLTSDSGETRKNLRVDLPPHLIKPNSKLQVFFRMNSKDAFDKQTCLTAADNQLIGTVHADTSFDLKREISVKIPNLELLQFGFPFTAPQDLSRTVIVVPQNPSETDILTLLAISERLGRLSQADSVKLNVFTPEALPDAIRKNEHLIGIGVRDKFPIPEVFKSTGFNLSQAFSRVSAQGVIQTPQDTQGMIKEVVSPWNEEHVILALTAQTESGLDNVRQVITSDPWFFQLKQDTILISSDSKDSTSYDPNAYQLEFFQTASTTNRVEDTTLLSKITRLIEENWLLLPIGILGLTLLLYGTVQLYLKRLTPADRN
ncbi:MAG: cellulose biosynthesis cyclic di-GMP-binding regulatory protein BcsB [Scytonema sp. PMC 1069.18]|nr:cellulose biosynthesis cyclic di-GMP-binding regulatory protein BcsB [Scytonema sp. PMC 1069.18]MEC4880892.1 cellulose biosynthesis cyclic di-GMP-binding regulatory protein BcsB [Scytonema sp. PMC 1070.18]